MQTTDKVLEELEKYFDGRADTAAAQAADPEFTLQQRQNRVVFSLAFRHAAWKISETRSKLKKEAEQE